MTKINIQIFLQQSCQHAPIIPTKPKRQIPIPTPNPIPRSKSINWGLILANDWVDYTVNKIIIAAPTSILAIEIMITNNFAQGSKQQEHHWHKFHNHQVNPQHILNII